MKLGMAVGLGPGHIVLHVYPARKVAQPQSSAYVRCAQTAGWIKMPRGMELDLGPGDTVLDGDPVPPKRDTAAIIGPRLLWPYGLMHQATT